MDVIKGVVSKLRNSVEISGGGNDSGVTTTHVTVFQIKGQPVKVKSREAVLVDESDIVAVSGKISNGVFNAYAYINHTTGVTGNTGIGIHYFFGLVFSLVGAFVIYRYSGPYFGVLPMVSGTGLIMIGLYTVYKGTQISNASKLLLSRWLP